MELDLPDLEPGTQAFFMNDAGEQESAVVVRSPWIGSNGLQYVSVQWGPKEQKEVKILPTSALFFPIPECPASPQSRSSSPALSDAEMVPFEA